MMFYTIGNHSCARFARTATQRSLSSPTPCGWMTALLSQSSALFRRCRNGIGFPMQRIKAMVAMVLALVWLPAASCCLIDAAGWFGKQDCCSKEHSQSVPGPGGCDQPCAALASATLLPQQGQPLIFASVGVLLFDSAIFPTEIQRPVGTARDLPATAPPELAGHWQFSFRTALAPRAPSFAS